MDALDADFAIQAREDRENAWARLKVEMILLIEKLELYLASQPDVVESPRRRALNIQLRAKIAEVKPMLNLDE